MAYITGSVTDANPGPALYALMAPALTAAGYTLVDTVTIAPRTHKIHKSPAASNVQGLDWYLDIGYTTTGAGTISLVAFEFYDPATDLGYRGPFASGSGGGIVDAATGSRYGATGAALETNWFPNASTASVQTTLTTTAFGYWITITADRVILLCTSAPSVVMYAGFYAPDPLYTAKAASLLYPLVTGSVGASGSSGAGLALTRVPPWTSLPVNWNQTAASSLAPTGFNYPPVPTGTTSSYPFTATAVPIVGGTSLPAGRWGWFRDAFLVATTGVVRGDTCTIDGVQHILSTTGTTTSVAFKAA